MKITLAALLVLVTSCGSKSHDHNDAPKPNVDDPKGVREVLGKWERRSTGVTANLNSIADIYKTGLIGVGDSGTVIVSTDEGQTWVQKDLGTKENLNKIAWVDKVVYIAGDNTILMSTDSGKSFVAAGKVTGKIRDIVETSSHSKPETFWAVGADGLVLKATLPRKLEDLKPESLVWEKVDISGAGNLNGVTFSFDNGLIVGENGFMVETRDGGSSFKRVTEVSTKANLYTVDHSETIGGEGVVMRRTPISGMPLGSFQWTKLESSELPNIRNVTCISDCMAVGSTKSGSTIQKLNVNEHGSLEPGVVEASGIADHLSAIIWGPSRYVAVGSNGVLLVRSKGE